VPASTRTASNSLALFDPDMVIQFQFGATNGLVPLVSTLRV
jgi:hypothetical protein